MGVLWTCGTVFIICTWSCVHLNLPTVSESEAGWHCFHKIPFWPQKLLWCKWGRRAGLMLVIAVVPEYAVAMAVQQRIEAQNCLREARKIVGDPYRYTLAHAYLANMGGIVLKSRDYFEVDVEDGPESGAEGEYDPSVTWDFMSLEGFAQWQLRGQHFELAENDIQDKSKFDAMTMFIAIAQCFSLMAQTIARTVAGLATTQLELITLAFAANAVLAYIIWRDKPFGVERQVAFVLSRNPRQQCLQERDCSSLTTTNTTEDYPGMIHSGQKSYRVDNMHHRFSSFKDLRIGDTNVTIDEDNNADSPAPADYMEKSDTSITTSSAPLDLGWHNCISTKFIKGNAAIYSMGSITAAIQISAWNWSFPNRIAKVAWRTFGVASFSGILIPVISLLIFFLSRLPIAETSSCANAGRRISYAMNIVFGAISGVYIFARVGSVVLAFYCLASLPESAMKAIQWTAYLPSLS